MNTKNNLPLNGTMVEDVTRTLRAYKHRFRYDIIGILLNHGPLPLEELASYLNLDEPYVQHHLGILEESNLVRSSWGNKGECFEANEVKLAKVKQSVTNLFQSF